MKFTLIFFAVLTTAWGPAGHQITAEIATAFLTPQTQSAINALLPPGQTLSHASTWADEIKHHHDYDWAYRYHFIDGTVDTEASPNSAGCTVSMERDCQGGCVVSAIRNYTARVVADTSIEERREALRFLVHFIGDVHQPLHTCGIYRGGNDYRYAVLRVADVRVHFDHRSTSMHGLWDGLMINKLIKDEHGRCNECFVSSLVTRIKDEWYEEQTSWLSCVNPSSPSIEQAPICPLVWAVEGNKLNCGTVWTGINHMEDLAHTYYQTNKRVLEMQLAKGGLRLATALNLLLDQFGKVDVDDE